MYKIAQERPPARSPRARRYAKVPYGHILCFPGHCFSIFQRMQQAAHANHWCGRDHNVPAGPLAVIRSVGHFYAARNLVPRSHAQDRESLNNTQAWPLYSGFPAVTKAFSLAVTAAPALAAAAAAAAAFAFSAAASAPAAAPVASAFTAAASAPAAAPVASASDSSFFLHIKDTSVSCNRQKQWPGDFRASTVQRPCPSVSQLLLPRIACRHN